MNWADQLLFTNEESIQPEDSVEAAISSKKRIKRQTDQKNKNASQTNRPRTKFMSAYEKAAQKRAEVRAQTALQERRESRKIWNERHRDGWLFEDSAAKKEGNAMNKWAQYSNQGAKPPANGFLRLRGQAGGARPQRNFTGARTQSEQPKRFHRTALAQKPTAAVNEAPKRMYEKPWRKDRPQESRFNQARMEQFAQRDYERSQGPRFIETDKPSQLPQYLETAKSNVLGTDNKGMKIPDPVLLFQLRSIGVQTENTEQKETLPQMSPANTVIKTLARRKRRISRQLCSRATSPFKEDTLRKIFGPGFQNNQVEDQIPPELGAQQGTYSPHHTTKPHVPMQSQRYPNQTNSELSAHAQLVSEMSKMMKAVAELVHGHSVTQQSQSTNPPDQRQNRPESQHSPAESVQKASNAPEETSVPLCFTKKKPIPTSFPLRTDKKVESKYWSEADEPKPLMFQKQNNQEVQQLVSSQSSRDAEGNVSVPESTGVDDSLQFASNQKCNSTQKDSVSPSISSASKKEQPSKEEILERLLQKLDEIELHQDHFERQEGENAIDEKLKPEVKNEKKPEVDVDNCLPLGIMIAAVERLIDTEPIDKENAEISTEIDRRTNSTSFEAHVSAQSNDALPPSSYDISLGENKIKEIHKNVSRFERHRNVVELSLNGTGVAFHELIEMLSEEMFSYVLDGIEAEYDNFFEQYAERLVGSL